MTAITRNKPVIVLDRDGVINRDSPDYIKAPDEWNALPGSLEAIAQLTANGFQVYVATNQSGIGRGLYSEATYKTIERKMLDEVASAGGKIEKVFYCPHSPDDNCDCRKPSPKLLQDVIAATGADGSDLIMIGDSLRDLQAAESVDAQQFLVLTGNGIKTLNTLQDTGKLREVCVYDDLADAVDAITGDAQ